MHGAVSGKIAIYEPALLSDPAIGIIRCEGGSEVEFATAGTRFALKIERYERNHAPLGLLWKIHE